MGSQAYWVRFDDGSYFPISPASSIANGKPEVLVFQSLRERKDQGYFACLGCFLKFHKTEGIDRRVFEQSLVSAFPGAKTKVHFRHFPGQGKSSSCDVSPETLKHIDGKNAVLDSLEAEAKEGCRVFEAFPDRAKEFGGREPDASALLSDGSWETHEVQISRQAIDGKDGYLERTQDQINAGVSLVVWYVEESYYDLVRLIRESIENPVFKVKIISFEKLESSEGIYHKVSWVNPSDDLMKKAFYQLQQIRAGKAEAERKAQAIARMKAEQEAAKERERIAKEKAKKFHSDLRIQKNCPLTITLSILADSEYSRFVAEWMEVDYDRLQVEWQRLQDRLDREFAEQERVDALVDPIRSAIADLKEADDRCFASLQLIRAAVDQEVAAIARQKQAEEDILKIRRYLKTLPEGCRIKYKGRDDCRGVVVRNGGTFCDILWGDFPECEPLVSRQVAMKQSTSGIFRLASKDLSPYY